MKKIFMLLIGLILFIPCTVLANSISNIDIDVYVDNSGTAHVTEEWNTYLYEGTEGNKPYYNLGESIISNFKVSMNNEEFTYVENWNTSGSFEDKKYKNGINYISDGIELCFGISSYGSNTYKLSYDISNFVANTSDNYQMIYWTLFPYDYNPSPGRVYIKIYSDFKYSDTLDVWGYGKYGAPTHVYDGYIEMDSESTVFSDEYMTLLIKFPSNTFNTSVTLDKSFDDYYEMAEEGAIHYSSDDTNFPNEDRTDNERVVYYSSHHIDFFDVIGCIIGILLSIILSIKISENISNKTKYGTYILDFGKTGKKTSTAPFYRDLPYKMDELSKGYWIAIQYDLISKPTDYLGALLLKWLKLGNISIQKKGKNGLLGDKEETSIIFNNCSNLDNLELKLYNMMYTASGDGILEKNEFEKWCKKNYSKISKWFNNVIDAETEKLILSGSIIKKGIGKKCLVEPNMLEEAKKMAGLKKFLNDFSNIKDRSAIEVNLWQEYLMFAQIFGIARKVMKEFKKLYPEVITEEVSSNIDFINVISCDVLNSVVSARVRTRSYVSNSYFSDVGGGSSSGGGGFSSGGGGGGSFGGGGGGGGFR